MNEGTSNKEKVKEGFLFGIGFFIAYAMLLVAVFIGAFIYASITGNV